jgi:hypothetical protein
MSNTYQYGDGVSFDPAKHQYFKGKPHESDELESVTRIEKIAGLVDTRWFKPEHANRGSRVHQFTADYDTGVLNESEIVDDEHYGYVEAWKKFCEDYNPKFSRIEWMLSDEYLGIAGTIDRVGTIVDGKVRRRCLLDIKTGAKSPSHHIQTAAYYGMLVKKLIAQGEVERAAVAVRRYLVYIKKTGKYSVVECKDLSGDQMLWNAALTVARYRIKHRLYQEG